MTDDRRRKRLPLLLPFLLSALLACNAPLLAPTPTPLPPTPPPALTPQDSGSLPVPTAALTPLPSATPIPVPTATLPAPVLTPTASPDNTEDHLAIFEHAWELVNDLYLYPDFNGADWTEVHDRYRPLVAAGQTDAEFYAAMSRMMDELGDEHSGFQDPQTVAEEEASFQGNNDYVGVGILVQAVPEKDRAVIIVTFPGSPAEAAGITGHDNLLAADGQPILDEDGYLRDIVRGPESTTVVLTIQTPGQSPREIPVVRRRITGSIPIDHRVYERAGRRVGYVLLPTFADLTIPGQVEDALREMAAAGPLAGIIVDNRQNDGGADTVLMDTLALFTGGTLGHFISREDERPLEVQAHDAGGSQTLPLVVLVGVNTVSYGEVFSGVLQDTGRATIIGETTLGNVETLWGYDLSDGSRVWIARETFRPLNNPGVDWEETGIVPDIEAPARWEDFTAENDPGVLAALDYLLSSTSPRVHLPRRPQRTLLIHQLHPLGKLPSIARVRLAVGVRRHPLELAAGVAQ